MPRRTRTHVLGALAATVPLAAAGALAGAADGKSGHADHGKGKGHGKASFTYALPGEATYPEGIATDRRERRFYVSSTTDGTIFRGTVDKRRRAASVFLPGGADGRTTAVGVETDRDGRLYVAGGATGAVFVYDTRSRRLLGRFDTGAGGFLNDVAVTKDGDAYVTDSRRPNLYRISAEQIEAGTGTPEAIPYPGFDATPGAFNANGIVAPDRRSILFVNSGAGTLHRLDRETKAVTTVDLRGATLTRGDGMELKGRTLYVVRNALGKIAKVKLAGTLDRGRVVSETGDPTFRYPTTTAVAGSRLLTVNSQFDRRNAGEAPELPFTVSSTKRP